ncbi:uncharacterized protein LOC135489984 [Lineus longissimus]|uniref:uncharacterized protein LOC135489984 n=1 Tax=Lineus longissimus TaxID=88925 RepID=UPI00315D976E
MGAGNLLLSAAVLFSGTTYAKLADMSSYLKMPILGKSQFYVLQKQYLFPVVNETWITCQTMVLDGLSQESDIVLSGDGRCDSPGHCAKYCTYSVMDTKTGLIVDFTVKNKADPSVKNSNAMEPMGLRECLNNLKKWDINISILATDRHTVIRKIMRVEFPEIAHQFDLWHFCKSILKKITKACGKKKPLAPLLEWMQSISNHFWWSAESCNGSVDILQEKWKSVINHTANIHSWRDKEHFHQCEHPPLSDVDRRQKSWLGVGSQAHDALVKIVQNKNVRKDLKKCTLFRHTGDLEVYHSLMLKYAPKRQHFSYEGIVCRTQLAAIDHNYGSGRQQATTKLDQPRYNVVQPKTFTKTNKWVAKQVKVAKDHSY